MQAVLKAEQQAAEVAKCRRTAAQEAEAERTRARFADVDDEELEEEIVDRPTFKAEDFLKL